MTSETYEMTENGTPDAIAREVEEHLTSLLGWDPDTPIDRRKRFEMMGVDSLMAMDMLAVLEKRYGSLPDTVLRDKPTIAQLAEYLHRLEGKSRA